MSSIALASLIHVLLAVVWVGGMFFAYVVLRPAAGQLDPPVRLRLWAGVFRRFFPWVWAAVVLVPLAGYWLGMRMYGSPANFPLHVNIMQTLGWLMVLVFLVVYFVPYRRLSAAVAGERWQEAGTALQGIRRLIGFNLTLGLIVAAVASGGRLWA